MALFQKKPLAGTAAPLYSLGLQKTLLLVGLGNVGETYDGIRHNIGFAAIDHFADKNDFPKWVLKNDLKAHITQTNMGDNRVILIKPTTLMNLSGEAIQAVMHFYKIPISQVMVVHDELDIPFGQIRMRHGGGSAGNNGIKSTIERIGADFARIRVGIQNEIAAKADAADFVLGKFTAEEKKQLPQLLQESNAVLGEYVYSGGQINPETRSFIV